MNEGALMGLGLIGAFILVAGILMCISDERSKERKVGYILLALGTLHIFPGLAALWMKAMLG